MAHLSPLPVATKQLCMPQISVTLKQRGLERYVPQPGCERRQTILINPTNSRPEASWMPFRATQSVWSRLDAIQYRQEMSGGRLSGATQNRLNMSGGRPAPQSCLEPPRDRCRSSAEEFGRMFDSATCDYSAEVRPNFGKHSASFVASHLRRFALATGVK